jgi:hypothetical protein
MATTEHKLLRSDDHSLVSQHWWHKSGTGVLLLVLMMAPLDGQIPGTAEREVTSLPATTGAPLTIVPLDGPDIDCSIQEWNGIRPKPYLKLLCPPETVYAPVRIYLKLSWLKPDDMPKDVENIIARAKQSTRIRSSESTVMVRMEVSAGKGQNPQVKWVNFSGVVDVALLTDSRRR